MTKHFVIKTKISRVKYIQINESQSSVIVHKYVQSFFIKNIFIFCINSMKNICLFKMFGFKYFYCYSIKTSNARLCTRLALSRRRAVSGLSANYLFTQFQKINEHILAVFFCQVNLDV